MTHLIVSLEDVSLTMAEEIAEHLSDSVWGFKIHTLFSQHGVQAIKALKPYGRVFVDRKLWDIPHTVSKEVSILSMHGADMVTVHCHGNPKMLEAAKLAADNCKVVGVTFLSDYITDNMAAGVTLGNMIRKAHDANLDGIVVNPKWLTNYMTYGLPIIAAGIRPDWYSAPGDHVEPLTPSKAVELGSQYLVLGSCLFQEDGRTPREKVELIHAETQTKAA